MISASLSTCRSVSTKSVAASLSDRGAKRAVLASSTAFSPAGTSRSVPFYCQSQSSMSAQQTDPAQAERVVTIIGRGRIGSALAGMSPYPTKVITRGDEVGNDTEGPIIVCTRNDDLQAVLNVTPTERWPDLVFVQNGMLLPWLTERGLEDNTQALIYFGVPKMGATPMDGITSLDPDGLTRAYGKHANTFCDVLKAGGLTCQVLEKEAFLSAMLEKLIWISAVMLVGAEHGVNVGDVNAKHKEEVSELMRELAAAGTSALGVSVSENMVERLCAYSESVASYPCGVKEFEWRNGWFYGLTQKVISEGKEDPCPQHTSLLKKVAAV